MDIAALAVLLVLSGFFSGTETAFTSLSIVSVHTIKKRSKRKGKQIEYLKNHPQILLTTILIGNNLVNIGATALATSMTIRYFENPNIAAMTGILTLIVLIFGEVTPKQIAIAKNETICRLTAPFIIFLSWIFRPLIIIISSISTFITKLFAPGGKKEMTEENLIEMVNVGEKLGVVEKYESQMVKEVFRINDTPVNAIMTHRKDVFSLEATLSVKEALPQLLEQGFSRVPIYEEEHENIVGIILYKELIRLSKEDKETKILKDFLYKPIFVPHLKKVNEVFVRFKIEKLNMAVVLDEYGGLNGIVTREDILEEIFGEMYDEDETFEEASVIQLNETTWKISGDASFYDIEDKVGIELEHDIKTQTINGYLIEKTGTLPKTGMTIESEEGSWAIEKVESNCIESLLFIKKSG